MNISDWLFFALLSWLLFGLWGFFGKIASRTLSPQNLLMVSSLGWVSILPVFFWMYRKFLRVELANPDFYYALLSGLTGSAGVLFFYFALSRGATSRVVAITAAYPLITAALAFLILREPFTLIKGVGLALAMAGIYLLSVGS